MIPWVLFFGMLQQSSMCQTIQREQILGEDLIRALPAFAGMPRDAVIGYSPSPGATRVLMLAELKRIGLKYDIGIPDNSRTCFQWKLRLLDEEAVRAAIRASLAAPQARVDVLAMSKAPIPEGKLEFPISGIPFANVVDPATPVAWNGYVLYSGNRKFATWARVRVASTTTRVVAVEALAPGKSIETRQIRIETYDEFPLHNDIARSVEEVEGRVPRRGIRAGLPVFRSELAEAFQVQRGEPVRITAISGGAQVETEGIANASGRQGDSIGVTNPQSGKTFRARIEGRGRAIVLAGPTPLLARVP
jgi:flagella basal body P-ring formation protein FlgA